jgi:hypothetical protein
MSRGWIAGGVLCGLVGACALATFLIVRLGAEGTERQDGGRPNPPPPSGPFAAIIVKSLGAVERDVTGLVAEADPEARVARMWQTFVANVKQGNYIEGLDPDLPLGLYVDTPAAGQEAFPWVAFVPIKSESHFLGWLRTLGLDPQQASGGLYRVQLPAPDKALSIRLAGRYAFAALDPQFLTGTLPDVAGLVPAEDRAATVSVRYRPASLSEENRKRLLDLLDSFQNQFDPAAGPAAQGPDEPDADYALRLARRKYNREVAIGPLITDLDTFTTSVGMDPEHKRVVWDFRLTLRPGTKLHAELREWDKRRSQFSHLGEGALFHYYGGVAWMNVLAAFVGRSAAQLERESLRLGVTQRDQALIRRFYRAIAPNLQTEWLDAGVAFRKPAGRPAVLVAGLGVKEAGELEQIIHDALKREDLKNELRGAPLAIQWQYARHGDTPIHLVQLGLAKEGPDKALQDFFGKGDVYVAFPRGAVLFSIGEQGLPALKQALDDLNRKERPGAARIQMELDLLQGSRVVLETLGDQPRLDKLRQLFPDLERERVTFAVAATMGADSRARMTIDSRVFRLLAGVEP